MEYHLPRFPPLSPSPHGDLSDGSYQSNTLDQMNIGKKKNGNFSGKNLAAQNIKQFRRFRKEKKKKKQKTKN